MAKTRKQRESDLKLARQGFMILALLVGVLVWGSSRSLVAGIVVFGVILIGLEFLLVIAPIIKQLRSQRSGAPDVDSLSWFGFEKLVASLFRDKGYRTRLTPFYDYGADVIADGNGECIAIQVKHSSGRDIGNKGVQQAVAALKYYNATRAMVVTNRCFTQSAINLAKANGVDLWDRDRLAREMPTARPPRSSSVARSVLKAVQTSPPRWSSGQDCPKCGAHMVRRDSRYGPFWGCSMYPGCRGKRRL